MGSRSLFALSVVAGLLSVTRPSQAAPSKSASKTPTSKTASKSSDASATTTEETPPAPEAPIRRLVAGGPTYDDGALGADTPELRALYEAERELFPPASPAIGTAWPAELPFPIAAAEDRPRVHASGLPPKPPESEPPKSDGPRDLVWLTKLDLPDLPVRWDGRVVRYLEFFKDDRRGRAVFTKWLKRSGRYGDAIKKVLRTKGMPEGLVALAMIESGFDPKARSRVGALGLWQFMPRTGKLYGLASDRWADLRMNPPASTEAAADYLGDLHRRFGSWELAMAAYNMGYGGVISAVRRYNTNDYWALSKLEGSLPWETTLYVPKIVAAAVVMKNLSAFGYDDVELEPSAAGEEVLVPPSTSLKSVARACATTTDEIEALNPELRASRIPPGKDPWKLVVPAGKGETCSQNLAKIHHESSSVEQYVVKFGESLEQIAHAHGVPVSKLVDLNQIAKGEVIKGGTVLLVPKGASEKTPDPSEEKPGEKPVVVVPQDVFVYPDRHRVFYRVRTGDTVPEICGTFKVSSDEVRRWNDVDPSARLVDGMTLQLFVSNDLDLSSASVLRDKDVQIVVAGTEEFFSTWEDKGRRRIVVAAHEGDTLSSIGKKYGVSSSMMERINRRGRSETLTEGDRVVVWLPGPTSTSKSKTTSTSASNARAESSSQSSDAPSNPGRGPSQTPPLASAPAPERLPALP